MKRLFLIVMALFLSLSIAACGSSAAPTAGQTEVDTASEVEAVPKVPAIPESTEKPVLTLSSSEEELYIGESAQLSIDGDYALVWSSSDESIATVDENGSVTALSVGSAKVTAALAEDSSVSAEAVIQVVAHVDSISLSTEELTLLAGSDKADAALEVVFVPENAKCLDLKCESSDEEVVTVDDQGNLHAVAPGTATITVSSLDENCEAPAVCEVTVKQGVASITLSETEKELYLNERLRLNADVQPQNAEDRTVTWTSSDEDVAAVGADGTVTLLKAGETVIRCAANDGSDVAAECALKVFVGVQKLALDETNITLLVGSSEDLSTKTLVCTVTPEDSSFPDVTWTCSDPEIATISEEGVVTGVAEGRATITAVTTDPKGVDRIKANCTVTVGNAVQKIELSGIDEKLAKGSSQRFTVNFTPEKVMTPKLDWKSSNESVLTVDANGGVRAVGVGSATITATSTDGSNISTERKITVFQSVTSVSAVERGNLVLFEGQSMDLHATVAPEDATDKSLSWSSSDTSIATVDDFGSVKAKGAGNVVITATAKDGSEKNCRFNLLVEPAVPITIDSLGFGVYNANLLGITVKNNCSKTAIRNFDFDITLYSYDGSKLNTSGSYSLGKDDVVYANSTKTIKRTMSGVAWAQKIVITVTGVKISEDEYYSIPILSRETWTFTR